ncbi:MAG: T9SS type A sorting domain-containing protein [Chitinophagales bacterium]
MKRFFVISIALLFFAAEVRSQAALSLTTTSVSNSTPNLGDQISVLTKLKNVSATDTFTGNIDFLLSNIDSTIFNTSLVGKPAFAGTVLKLAPLEEKAALFTIDLLPVHFKAGPDIIIVWPVASVHIIDSAKAPITIMPALGWHDPSRSTTLIFTTRHELILDNSAINYSLEEVQIFNVLGRCVFSSNEKAMQIKVPISDWPSGLYFVRFKEESGYYTRPVLVK